MKILLINECSNLHTTLAKGLKQLGHQVTTLSGGNGWRNFPRDISLVRHNSSHLDGLRYLVRLYSLLPQLRHYDVIQINNPIFFDLRAERLFSIYRYLRRHNTCMFMGAFGTDHYWVKTSSDCHTFRYSDHNFGPQLRHDQAALTDRAEWLGTTKERLNTYIAKDCDAVIPCLYEYWASYHPCFPSKTQFIPLPIAMPQQLLPDIHDVPSTVRIFIGIDRERSAYKGTDIMLEAAKAIVSRYPHRSELRIVESVPFDEYQHMMDTSDVLLDQLYSYTPGMNALLAMSKGIVAVGGGEPENYEILGETELRPIVNVQPNYESVYHELEQLVLYPERIPQLKHQSIEYVRRHHEYIKVARQYEQLYMSYLHP